jgi:hypothetical protein
MTGLVKFDLENGSSILVEADGGQGDVVVRGRRVDSVVAATDETFESALARVLPASAAIIERFRDMHHSADEIELEFGLKVNAEAGAIIARTSGEANFQITLRWRSQDVG